MTLLISSPFLVCKKGLKVGSSAQKSKSHNASREQVEFLCKGQNPSSYRGNAHRQCVDQNLPSYGHNPLYAGWEKT